MANYQVVSKNSHADKRWRRFQSYEFAKTDAIAPLVLQEFPTAAMHLPIGFMPTEDSFTPVAIQGLQVGRNLLVAADGRWLGGYVPAKYRSYPFALGDTTDGNQVLCIDEESGLLTDNIEDEALFDGEGAPTATISEILKFLSQLGANREPTARVCKVLKDHDLIQPWPIKIETASGLLDIDGLFRIDEDRLNALALEALDTVHKAGALPIAYLQLISMQHLSMLGQLADAFARLESPASALPESINLDYFNNSGSINFDNF